MTDRELLELAAKGAGIAIDKSPDNGGGAGNTGFDMLGNAVLDWHNGKTWNPLTNDGDALRLAVQNSMRVYVYRGGGDDFTIVALDELAPMKRSVREDHGDDPEAATRRAIVRAAAELGGAGK